MGVLCIDHAIHPSLIVSKLCMWRICLIKCICLLLYIKISLLLREQTCLFITYGIAFSFNSSSYLNLLTRSALEFRVCIVNLPSCRFLTDVMSHSHLLRDFLHINILERVDDSDWCWFLYIFVQNFQAFCKLQTFQFLFRFIWLKSSLT